MMPLVPAPAEVAETRARVASVGGHHDSAPQLPVSIVADLQADDVAIALNALAASPHEANAFMRRWFVEPSRAHCDDNVRSRLYFAMRGVVPVAVFVLGSERYYGGIPMPHVAAWRHPNMFMAGAMIVGGEEDAAWAALLASLKAQGQHYLVFGPLDRDGAMAQGLTRRAAAEGYGCRLIHSQARALLKPDVPVADYWSRAINGKKRKELRRQERRLGEMGELVFSWLGDGDDLDAWSDQFLTLEAAGWKGREGSALAVAPGTETMFRKVLAGARAAGSLAFCRLTLDGRAIAMLTTLIDGTAGFSFKTTYAETLSAYSPGVLLQWHNLALIDRARLDWIDSCAAPDHPMIDALWTERRRLGWYAVSLTGGVHRLIFDAIHAAMDIKHELAARRGTRR